MPCSGCGAEDSEALKFCNAEGFDTFDLKDAKAPLDELST